MAELPIAGEFLSSAQELLASGWTTLGLLAALLHAGHNLLSIAINRRYGIDALHESVTRGLLRRYGEPSVWLGWCLLWSFCWVAGLLGKFSSFLMFVVMAGAFARSFVNWRQLRKGTTESRAVQEALANQEKQKMAGTPAKPTTWLS